MELWRIINDFSYAKAGSEKCSDPGEP